MTARDEILRFFRGMSEGMDAKLFQVWDGGETLDIQLEPWGDVVRLSWDQASAMSGIAIPMTEEVPKKGVQSVEGNKARRNRGSA